MGNSIVGFVRRLLALSLLAGATFEDTHKFDNTLALYQSKLSEFG